MLATSRYFVHSAATASRRCFHASPFCSAQRVTGVFSQHERTEMDSGVWTGYLLVLTASMLCRIQPGRRQRYRHRQKGRSKRRYYQIFRNDTATPRTGLFQRSRLRTMADTATDRYCVNARCVGVTQHGLIVGAGGSVRPPWQAAAVSPEPPGIITMSSGFNGFRAEPDRPRRGRCRHEHRGGYRPRACLRGYR